MNSDVYNINTRKKVIFTNPYQIYYNIKRNIILEQKCSVISEQVFSLTDNINEFKSAWKHNYKLIPSTL